MNAIRRIQYVNDLLLHITILYIVKCVDAHRLRKDFTVTVSNCRNRIRDNRKAALLTVNIFIDQLTDLTSLIHRQLLLTICVLHVLRLLLRCERLRAKNVNNRRSAVPRRDLLKLLPCAAFHFQTALDKWLIQPQTTVFLVIILILFVLRDGKRLKHRLQSDCFKILNRKADHPLKSHRIADFCHIL